MSGGRADRPLGRLPIADALSTPIEVLMKAPGESRWSLCHPGDMCRNIRVLHNFDPPATADEVNAAALQYVRKVSGTTKPSKANQEAFDEAVHDIAHATQ